jgi:RNA polymerase sigma-70 factor (ECF subfamily)
MAEPVDDAFIDSLLRCDQAAWGALYDAHVREIYAFVNHLLEGDRGSTDDVNQDVWLQAMSSIGKFDNHRGELRDWLFGIARRRVAFHFRKRLASAAVSLSNCPSELALADGELLLPEEVMERLERKHLVQAAFIAIPEVHRHVLYQKYVHGHSVQEIAAAMQLTVKAVESLLWRARGRLRSLLGSYFQPASREEGMLR